MNLQNPLKAKMAVGELLEAFITQQIQNATNNFFVAGTLATDGTSLFVESKKGSQDWYEIASWSLGELQVKFDEYIIKSYSPSRSNVRDQLRQLLLLVGKKGMKIRFCGTMLHYNFNRK